MGDLTWVQWVQLVEIPALLGLVWYATRIKDDLMRFKVEVAERYASIQYLKDVEKRLIMHLERIEDSLDKLRSSRNSQ